MNRLDAMQLFVRAADLGSFAAVASQLGVARSVVTRQIAALEAHLGVKLMARTTRRLTLTSAGAAYLAQCRTILDLVDTAEADLMEARLTPRGRLRIGLPLSFGLTRIAPLLPAFLQRYPDIDLAIDFTDRRLDLLDEGIDLSIRIAARLAPGDVARKLGESRLLTVAAPDYLARHGHPAHPAELSAHRCLGYSPKANNPSWSFRIDGRAQSIYPPFRLQANNGDALREAATQGLGLTVLPDFIVADALARGALVTVLEAFEPAPLGIYALLPGNRYLPQRVRVLLDFFAAQLEPTR